MPEKSALCPYIAPKPSRILAGFLLSVHALSFLAAWLNPLTIWVKLLLSLIVLISLGLVFMRDAKVQGIFGVQLKPDGSWVLHLAEGSDIEARLLGSSIVNPWFVLLHLRTEKKRYSMLIPKDSLEPDAFRRLRVALRVAGGGDIKDTSSQ